MNEIVLLIVGLLLLGFGLWMGFSLGEQLAVRCVTKGEYWRMNAIVVLVGAVVSGFVWSTGFVMIAAATVGTMAGAIAGLKFGFGESAGPWKAHDKAFRVNKDHLETAESGKGEARRKRRRDGGPEPELISVAQDPPKNANRRN